MRMRRSPLRHGSIVLAVSSALCLSSAQRVQSQSVPARPRPEFDNLRFREDWSRSPTGDPLDPLKHILLTDGGTAWLSLGGQLRVRGESVRNFLGGGAGTRTDGFALLRAQLHADVHVGPHVRAFVEGRFADVKGRELPGGARALDRDRGDWGNAFIEATGNLAGFRSSLRLGRQEMQVGRERIVSPLDWANVRRVFQGASVESRRGALAFGAFTTRPLIIHPDRQDVSDSRTRFSGSTLAWRPPRGGRLVEGALLFKSVDGASQAGTTHRATATVRFVTPILRPDLVIEVEGGAQRADAGAGITYASMIASDLTWSPAIGGTPAFTLGLDRASGTSAGESAQSGTWDQLYPLGHAYAGFADVLGRRNLVEERVVAQLSPRPAIRVRTAAHAFQRASSADAAYDVSGGVLRAASGAASTAIGVEFDASVQWRLGRHVRVDGGVARFEPGQFLRDTGSARPYSWFFSSITATF